MEHNGLYLSRKPEKSWMNRKVLQVQVYDVCVFCVCSCVNYLKLNVGKTGKQK